MAVFASPEAGYAVPQAQVWNFTFLGLLHMYSWVHFRLETTGPSTLGVWILTGTSNFFMWESFPASLECQWFYSGARFCMKNCISRNSQRYSFSHFFLYDQHLKDKISKVFYTSPLAKKSSTDFYIFC
jgi:hypothetical protein